jgi:hypothetical protein
MPGAKSKTAFSGYSSAVHRNRWLGQMTKEGARITAQLMVWKSHEVRQ